MTAATPSGRHVRPAATHWYDLICPFCYVGQSRTRLLRDAGFEVVELPFQIHPEIGPGGVAAPHRVGPTYDLLAREAEAAGLPLVWSDRIAYSGSALTVAEIARSDHPDRHAACVEAAYAAYFGAGRDIGDLVVLAQVVGAVGLPTDVLEPARDTAYVASTLAGAAQAAREHGVTATPTWQVGDRRIVGLQPASAFG